MAEMEVSIEGVVPTGGTLPVSGSLTTTPSGTQNVAVTSPTTFPVSGTVTTTPSGTQNVAVTSPATFPVSGTVTALPSGTQAVSGTVTAVAGQPPGASFYLYNIPAAAGVVGANNFLSLFNPAASGKTVSFYALTVTAWSSGATTATVPMNIFRITAASAGTLIAASTMPRFATSSANPAIEVRTGNPTVTTTGIASHSIPPAITTAGAGVGASTQFSTVSSAPYICAPGEGVVLQTTSGDVDQLWTIHVIWSEA